jgi:hypothetical protein
MTNPRPMVDYEEKKIAIQSVIDRINEFGEEYLNEIDFLNEKFNLSNKSKSIYQDAKNKRIASCSA